MKKLFCLIMFAVTLCSIAALAEEKAPQDKSGAAASSTADNVGKGASQLRSDVSRGTGTILDGVGKFLQELGQKLGGTSAHAPTQSAPQTPSTSTQQSETLSPAKK